MEPVSRSERIFQGRAYVRHLYRGLSRIEHRKLCLKQIYKCAETFTNYIPQLIL